MTAPDPPGERPAGSAPPSTTPPRPRRPAGRPATLTEQARRAQLTSVTIDLVAEHGYGGCSLQRIADAAGITKAAVIYHFETKDAVIRAAYDSVIDALTEHVGAAVEAAASPAEAVDAYVTGMISHFAAHPAHVRMIVEALADANDTGIEDRPGSPARWRPLAELIERAAVAGAYRGDLDARTLAIVLGGAIDAVVAESLTDPAFDLDAGAATILDLLHRTAGVGGPGAPA